MNTAKATEYYTLEEAREIINAEQKRKERRRKAKLAYYAKQKAVGLFLILIGVLFIAMGADGTFSVLAVPFGAYLLLTKKRVIEDNTKYEKRGR